MTNMADPEIVYDEPSDTLYITFIPGESGAGLSLNDHILLRADPERRRAISLMLHDFSILASQSEIGPRSFPLTGLDALPPEFRDLALELLHSSPVSDYLTLSAYSPAGTKVIPITLLNTEKLVARAA